MQKADNVNGLLSSVKAIAIYLIELVFVAYLGIILLVALTGGLTISLGSVKFTAYGFKNLLTILAVSLVLRKFVRGCVLCPFLFPPPMQIFLSACCRKFVSIGKRLSASAQFRRKVINIGAVIVILVSLAAFNHYWQQGLIGRYYHNLDWSDEPFFTIHDRDVNLRRTAYDLSQTKKKFSIQWAGVLYIPEAGKYKFTFESDDGSELWIDEQLIIDNGGLHPLREVSNNAILDKGFHPVNIRYIQGEDKAIFRTFWRPPGVKRNKPFRQTIVFPEQPGTLTFLCFQVCAAVLTLWKTLLLGNVVVAALMGCHAVFQRFSSGSMSFGTKVQQHVVTGEQTPSWEHGVYIAVLVGLIAVYIFVGFFPNVGRMAWGFSFWHHIGLSRTLALLILAGLVLFTYRAYRSQVEAVFTAVGRTLYVRKGLIFFLAVLGVMIFFVLRNEFVNTDGMMFRWLTPKYILDPDIHMNFDEMWEAYLHSVFWLMMNSLFGWTVRLSYQLLSAIGGGVFIMLLFLYARHLLPDVFLPFVLLMLSGGYMQLYFGDVENYTLTSVCLSAYFLSAFLYLRGKQSLIWPSMLLALAMAFHMLSAFLLPSVAFLYVLEVKEKRYKQIGMALLASAAVLVGTIFYHQIPFREETYGSWGINAIKYSHMWAFLAFDEYHWQQYNLLALMFPAHLLLLPLIVFKRIRLNRVNMYLIIATLCMFLFQFNYKALLGVYNDWNLFANAAIPMAILVWYNVLKIPELKYKSEILFGFFTVSSLHSYAWIVFNHYR